MGPELGDNYLYHITLSHNISLIIHSFTTQLLKGKEDD